MNQLRNQLLFLGILTLNSCSIPPPDNKEIFNVYLEETKIPVNWKSTDIVFVLRPNTGCKSCYKGLVEKLKTIDNGSLKKASYIFYGKPRDYPPTDLQYFKDRFETKVFIDTNDYIRNFNLLALNSGYFYKSNGEDFFFNQFIFEGGSILDSVIETF